MRRTEQVRSDGPDEPPPGSTIWSLGRSENRLAGAHLARPETGQNGEVSAFLEAARRVSLLAADGPVGLVGAASAVRGAIGAQSLLLMARNDADGTDIELLDGPLPPAGILGFLAAARVEPGGLTEFCVDGKTALVSGCAGRDGRGRLLVALRGVGASDRPLDVESELLSLFLEAIARDCDSSPCGGHRTAPVRLRVPDGMVLGRSEAIQGLLAHISCTIGSGLDVLLTGETGVGKELFARLVHLSGGAAAGPFVALNCAAIPSHLLEAELFGVSRRVATGVDARPGRIMQAEGGSIFLDEIGELPSLLQAKLLRFLQEREVLPLGAPSPRPVRVRVIAATNRKLDPCLADGCFRPDLFYRLRSLQFHIPPLRERSEDIPELAEAILRRASREFGRTIRGVTRKALAALMRYDWPGNVRELEAELRQAVLLCHPGDSLREAHFRSLGSPAGATRGDSEPHSPSSPRGGCSQLVSGPRATSSELARRIEETERLALHEALSRASGNRTRAARLLGITRNGLRMKLTRLGIPS